MTLGSIHVFLVMPISWKGTLQQYVGRIHRMHDGKRIVQVYDYADIREPCWPVCTCAD
jgi:superfamily II DNA or RNA helicase